MEWTQFIIFCLGVFGLFIWNRTEARADHRHSDAKIDAIRELVHEMHKEVMEERREFHARLCDIETRRR